VPSGSRIATAANSKSSPLPRSAGTAAPTLPTRSAALPVANAPPCQCTPETPRPLPANAPPPSPASSIRIDRSEARPPRTRGVAGHSMRCATHGCLAACRANRPTARRRLRRRRPAEPRTVATQRMARALRGNGPGAPAAAEPGPQAARETHAARTPAPTSRRATGAASDRRYDRRSIARVARTPTAVSPCTGTPSPALRDRWRRSQRRRGARIHRASRNATTRHPRNRRPARRCRGARCAGPHPPPSRFFPARLPRREPPSPDCHATDHPRRPFRSGFHSRLHDGVTARSRRHWSQRTRTRLPHQAASSRFNEYRPTRKTVLASKYDQRHSVSWSWVSRGL